MKTVNESVLIAKEDIMTEEIQEALNSSKKVILAEGIYSSGPLAVPSETEIVLEKGAEIRFIDDFDAYPPVFTRWEGVKCWCMHPCLFINEAENVKVTGEGTLNGQGIAWWKEIGEKKKLVNKAVPALPIELKLASLNPDYKSQPGGGGGRQTQFLRPPLVQINQSRHVTIEGINIINSPFWTVHPLFCEDLTLRNLNIYNPSDAPNTDGIDIESSQMVVVEKCTVDVGDDGIALKSGSGKDGIKDGAPSKGIIIKDCLVKNAHGGAVIGSETAGGVEDVHVSDCIFQGTERGVRIKTRRGRGGKIKNLSFSGIKMEKNLCPFVINMYYRCGSTDKNDFSLDVLPVTEETPEISGICLENCVATECQSTAGAIIGLPESPVRDVVIKDCTFVLGENPSGKISEAAMYEGIPDPPSRGFRLRNAEVTLENFTVIADGEKIIVEENVAIKD